MSTQKNVCILGATGSIGHSTLDVLARHPELYRPFVLTGHSRIERLEALCLQHKPAYAVTANQEQAKALGQRLKAANVGTEVLSGPKALCELASHPEVDVVMAAIVGAAGLPATLAAAQTGKRVLLANKEALVMSGKLFMTAVAESGAALLPVDSEHNAIFQCLSSPSDGCTLVSRGVRRILLTASGGPFRNTPLEELAKVTPEQACKHPNWSMGRKISVDSATLMNKGLELIEACWLFDAIPEQIEIVVHPQSIIHSMVDYVDGSVLAQLSAPDMRTPISYALAWPARIDSGVSALDLLHLGPLEFQQPDLARFPCLSLGIAAASTGGSAPVLLNAANEVAVAAFLAGRIGFTHIPVMIEAVLSSRPVTAVDDLEAVLAADAEGRKAAQQWLLQQGR